MASVGLGEEHSSTASTATQQVHQHSKHISNIRIGAVVGMARADRAGREDRVGKEAVAEGVAGGYLASHGGSHGGTVARPATAAPDRGHARARPRTPA